MDSNAMTKKRLFWLINITLFCALSAQDTSILDKKERVSQERQIYFSLNNDKLIDVVNRLAAQKRVNIILPADQKKLAETTVTFSIAHKIALSQAWELLTSMLNIAGFAMSVLDEYTYAIKPIDAAVREAAPLYVNTAIEMLPRNEFFIRYLYYFQNINLNDESSRSNLEKIIQDMLPAQQNAQYSLDKSFNSLLITGNAQVIRSVMAILRVLDQSGFRESIEVVPVVYTTAKEIAEVINKLVSPRETDDQFRFPPLMDTRRNSKTYFSSSTRVVSIDQTNSIAVFGLYESVQRVKDFIKKYLDKPVDADKTVLHVKNLKYLNAEKFAPTLVNLIKQQGDSAQSTGDMGKLFAGVVVKAEEEKPKEDEKKKIEGRSDIGVQLKEKEKSKGMLTGGNNLIVACTQRDWVILEKLIDQLDTEQWQVAIEVLIVDISYESTNLLGTQLRRMTSNNENNLFKWQSAQLDNAELDYTAGSRTSPTDINSKTGLSADLLSQQPKDAAHTTAYNLADTFSAGTTILSFKDGNGLSAVLAMLRNIADAKIVSQPFLITKNNEPAKVTSLETSVVQGDVDPSSVGGTAIVKYLTRVAATEVIIRPRISMPPDNINLEISVKANDFISSTVISKRTVMTNANVGHRQVLVLGGIAKSRIYDDASGVPVLSKVPILGYLFKGHERQYQHRNLMIFVVPTRIAPVSVAGRGISTFSHDKIDLVSKKFIQNSRLLGCPQQFVNAPGKDRCLQDPIARMLFSPEDGSDFAQALKDFETRGVWTDALIGDVKNDKDTSKPEKKSHASSSEKDDLSKLKDILKDEQNPFSSVKSP